MYLLAVHCDEKLDGPIDHGPIEVAPWLDASLWLKGLRRSRWFTRGWTLQELLAPSSVVFFCSNGTDRLGDRRSLEDVTHEITNIDIEVLRGKRLTEFPIEKRLLWAKGRKTTRGEDEAYSLMGILGVLIEPWYGDGVGETNAFKRLTEAIKRSRLESTDDQKSSEIISPISQML